MTTGRRTIVALLAAVAVLLGLNLLKPDREVIAGMQASEFLQARRIMIANDDGEPRVSMGMDLIGNGFIVVNDHEGNEVFSVRVNKVTMPRSSHSRTPKPQTRSTRERKPGSDWLENFTELQQGAAPRPEPPKPTKKPRPPKTPEKWEGRDNSVLAYNIMKEFVKRELVSPTTAKFPGMVFGEARGHIKRLPDHKYRIVSYVDSQNSFGAMIRTNFVGVVQQVSEDQMRLMSLDFTE